MEAKLRGRISLVEINELQVLEDVLTTFENKNGTSMTYLEEKRKIQKIIDIT